jgi:4-amino-4-deoxychorismate lyase
VKHREGGGETFFETIALFGGIPRHLAYHTRRFSRTWRDWFGATGAPDLETYIYNVVLPEEEAQNGGCRFRSLRCRLRIEYGAEGILSHRLLPYVPRTVRTLALIESDIRYPYKSTDRDALDALRSASGADDVLILHGGYLTDTTVANVALRQGNSWYTPARPLLPGTTRARLIDEGVLTPRAIHRGDLDRYGAMALLNALTGFAPLPQWPRLLR